MLISDTIKQLENDLVEQRNNIRYKHSQPIETLIKNTVNKLSTIIVLRYLLQLDLNKLNIIYQGVKDEDLTLDDAMTKAEV